MKDAPLFDEIDCKNVSENALSSALKKHRPKLVEMWVGVLIFPLFFIVFVAVLAYTESAPVLEENPWLGVFQIVGSLFFSHIIWSGSRSLRQMVRTKINLARNALPGLYRIEEMIREKRPYALYLRDYSNGESAHSVREVKLPSFVGGYAIVSQDGSYRMQTLTPFLEKHLPIVMLYNARDKTPDYAGHVLYCSDDKWFQNFMTLAENASLVVLDYSGDFEKSPFIRQEIEFVKKSRKPFIAVGTDEEIFKLRDFRLSILSDMVVNVASESNANNGFIVPWESKEKVFISEPLKKRVEMIVNLAQDSP